MKKAWQYIKPYFNLELIIWVTAIVGLAFANPEVPGIRLCLFHNLGFEFCPGCGLGHSIAYLLDGRIVDSWNAHFLGIFALGVILFRIFKLSLFIIKSNFYKPLKTDYLYGGH